MGVKKSVFVVTNFGTRVVVPVSVDCTVGDFKKEFESVHFQIHPGHGKLRVDSLKVEWKSFSSPLSDSLSVKLFLDGEEQCLHVMASKSEEREKEMQEEMEFRTSIDDSDNQRQGIIDYNMELQGADTEDPKSPLVNLNPPHFVPDSPAYRLNGEPADSRTMDSIRRLIFD